MAVRIEPYQPSMVPLVQEFNARLARGGIEFRFPEIAVSDRWPPDTGAPVHERFYLAVENGSAVRGGYILKHQTFLVRGAETAIGNIQLPLSEGTVDHAYSMVALRLLQDALRKQPLLYALGMGGLHNPFPRILSSMGWTLRLLPFYFRIVHARRFFRNIEVLRTSRARRLVLDALALSGLGGLGARALRVRARSLAACARGAECRLVAEFGDWADDVWRAARAAPAAPAFCAVRDAASLSLLYPPQNPTFLRARIDRAGRPIGWALLLATSMRGHKQFGDMRVGSIIDCLAAPGEAAAVMAAAAAHLVERDVDVVVTNQAFADYGAALQRAGFRRGPSNFVFAAAKKLAALLDPFDDTLPRVHLNRGDGDGPMHL